jgi:hypothetical protein
MPFLPFCLKADCGLTFQVTIGGLEPIDDSLNVDLVTGTPLADFRAAIPDGRKIPNTM